ncbi:MAG: hypothetical protein RLZZ297_1347 [Chloroflexota bacterium]|jgi:(2Fe-2S) ferredoxin
MTASTHRIYLCHGPFCHGETLRATLEAALRCHSLTDTVELRPSGCQSRCDDGPNLTIWPGPFRYCHLTAAHIETIVALHLGQHTVVESLLHPTSLRAFPPAE